MTNGPAEPRRSPSKHRGILGRSRQVGPPGQLRSIRSNQAPSGVQGYIENRWVRRHNGPRGGNWHRIERARRAGLSIPSGRITFLVGAQLCERSVPLIMTDMANRLHKLVLPLLLICHPVWAERLPVPPVPPAGSSPVRPVQVPHASAKAVLPRRTPILPITHASTRLATPAPMPDRDARPPPDPNASPHTKVTLTNFRPPTSDTDAGYPYGSRFRSPQDVQPIQTPGFTGTIPLRLP
jgi:hypothetical protein